MDDGTEALTGLPPVDPSLAGNPDAAAATPAPAAAPAAPSPDATPDLGGNQAPDLPAAQPAQVSQAQQPSGLDRILDSVANFLSPAQGSRTVIDDQGNRHSVPTPRASRGQQWAKIGLEALEGATTAAAAPAGPGHVGQGVAAAVQQQLANHAQAQAADQQQAEQDYARRMKTRQENLNYQLGVRDLAAKSFELTRRQVAAGQEDVNFAQKMEDREKELGSFDLGTYAGANDLHQIMEQQPDFFKKLGSNAIVAVPVFDADGKRAGIHVFERKAQVGAQPAPAGTQFAVFQPGAKAGEAPHLVWKTASDGQLSNDDVTRLNMAAMNGQMGYQKQQAAIEETRAKTLETRAEAAKVPSEIVKNQAEAARGFAEARKTKIEANLESSAANGTGGTGDLQQDAHMMVDGLASPEQFSKRSKDFNAMLPEANRYSMQKYGVPFDAEVSQGRFLSRRDTLKAFGSGKEGDQIQTFNQFVAHAGDLSQVIDQLRNTNSPLLNRPLKDLRKAMGDARYAQIEPMIAAVRTEHANFLNNNHALHDSDITEGHEMLSDDMSLAQMQAGIKGFTHTAIARLGSLNQRYRRVVGVGDVPEILDPYSRKVINGLGMGNEAQAALGTAWTNTPQVTQNRTTPPTPNTPVQTAPVAAAKAGAVSFNWNDHPVAQ